MQRTQRPIQNLQRQRTSLPKMNPPRIPLKQNRMRINQPTRSQKTQRPIQTRNIINKQIPPQPIKRTKTIQQNQINQLLLIQRRINQNKSPPKNHHPKNTSDNSPKPPKNLKQEEGIINAAVGTLRATSKPEPRTLKISDNNAP